MNAKQKNFILKKLIPFILREQGRGFAMSSWIRKRRAGSLLDEDDISREVPVCGTVCCIGGSVQVLANVRTQAAIAEKIGLTINQTNGLFYDWYGYGDTGNDGHEYGWPEKFATRFLKAETPYRKAQAAVALLKEVVKTNGDCLRLD